MPGGFAASLDVTSLNHIIQLAAPLLVNELLQNKTIDLNIDHVGTLHSYELFLTSIHFDDVTGPEIKDLSWSTNVPADIHSDMVTLTLGGINVDATMVGKVKVGFLPVHFKSFNITNITAQIDFAVDSTDDVHWQVMGASVFSVDDFTITFKEAAYNYISTKFHNQIMIGIQMVCDKISGGISTKTKALNTKVQYEGAMTWESNLLSRFLPFNATMTEAPKLDEATDLITFHMDGRFLDVI